MPYLNDIKRLEKSILQICPDAEGFEVRYSSSNDSYNIVFVLPALEEDEADVIYVQLDSLKNVDGVFHYNYDSSNYGAEVTEFTLDLRDNDI